MVLERKRIKSKVKEKRLPFEWSWKVDFSFFFFIFIFILFSTLLKKFIQVVDRSVTFKKVGVKSTFFKPFLCFVCLFVKVKTSKGTC
jgi:hypothetical protein